MGEAGWRVVAAGATEVAGFLFLRVEKHKLDGSTGRYLFIGVG